MVASKIKYCDHCQKEVEATINLRHANYTFKGETFEIKERVLQCSNGHDLYDEILDSETIGTLKRLYEERVGLTLEDIKSIRAQYDMSMNIFSRILGWSKATIVRYESGKYIPDSSHLSILKRLKEYPNTIDEHYKLNAHKFNEKEQAKIIGKLSNNDQGKVEKGLFEVLQMNYQLHEKTVESGYNVFNLHKLINMILYFSENSIQKTKLMKLLFYADFLYYKKNLLSISGMPYVRLPYGPVPKDHDLLLSSIDKGGFINIEYEYFNEYTFICIKPTKLFDDSFFNEEEMDILRKVKEYFIGYGSVAISEFSHQEDGWINTEDREIISYDFADTLKLNIDSQKK